MLKVIEFVVMVITYLQIKKSETAIHWCSLKCNHALKSHPNVKIYTNYRCMLDVLILWNSCLAELNLFISSLKISLIYI